jgi:hypothetical protein
MANTIASRPGRTPVIETAPPQKLAASGSETSSPAIVAGEAATGDIRPPRRRANPFGTHEQKLSYVPRPGYYRYWFNDVPNRIAQALEGGYTHVVGKDGKNVTRRVGIAQDGSALWAYLMEIQQEWYDEDMAAQQVEIEKVEAAMRRGAVPGGNAEGQYVPLRPDGSPRIQIVHGSR